MAEKADREISRFYRNSRPDRYELLKGYARELRHNMTVAENCIWYELKAKKLGVTFRRQHPIGDYIADFACLPLHLIIEIDGDYHNSARQSSEDKIRTDDLGQIGFKVLRYTNEDVLYHLDDVLKDIRENITQIIHINNDN